MGIKAGGEKKRHKCILLLLHGCTAVEQGNGQIDHLEPGFRTEIRDCTAPVTVLPVSADVRVIKKPNLTPLDFLPDAEALKMTTDALREWMGQRVYQMQAWN